MRWLWIDRIVDLEKGRRCVAVKNVSLAEDHLHDHFPAAPVMPVSLIIEGMAQTAGILVGHAREFRENVILAKIARAHFDRDVLPGHTLFYTAVLDRIDDHGASTSGEIAVVDHAADGGREPMGRVELTFSHVDPSRQRAAGLPEGNFVFTDQFMDLLRHSGHEGNDQSPSTND